MQQDSLRQLAHDLNAMPTGQFVFYILAVITWFGGVGIVFHRHRSRVGADSTWPALRHFNSREWLTLVALLSIAIALGAIGLSFQRR
jgi:hypothetical protein